MAYTGRQDPRRTKATTPEDWLHSDEYHNGFLIPQDEVLEATKEKNKAEGLPDIAVSTAQGKFLNLLARSIGAKRILEVGTLGGCVGIGDSVVCKH